MGQRELLRVGFVVVVAIATCLTIPSLGAAGGSPERQQISPFVQSQIDPDVVVMRSDVAATGDATWSIDFRVRLDDANASQAFESLQADIRANESAYTADFRTSMRRTILRAENATGRSMALENLSVSTTTERLPQEYGVLTYRFRWTNFATASDERIRIGDALAGFFLDRESALVLEWPATYTTESVRPPPDERGNTSVTWHGQTAFGTDEPRVVLQPADQGSATPSTVLLVASLLVLVVVGAGAAIGYRSRYGRSTIDSDDHSSPAGSELAEPTESQAADEDDPAPELLSNEERVLRLLEREGGRVKQQQIATEFDWTDAKTSQVVGNLRDEDAVETFRIGRENVVALPEASEL